MDIVRLGKNLTEIDKCIRVESGPPRKKGIATDKLLDNLVTASHYQVGNFDAYGKVIEHGKEMDYVDWKTEEVVFNVYELKEEIHLDKDDEEVVVERFMPDSVHPDYEAALTAAIALAEAR